MANLNGFNANEVEPAGSFEPIPAGKYPAAITESEMKPTKNGSGSYLQLTFTVTDGPYKNRVLWARLNLNNPNATAVCCQSPGPSAPARRTVSARSP